MGEWRVLKVQDIAANEPGSIAIGPFGSRMKSENYVDTGVPVVRGQNLGSRPGFVDDFVYVTQKFSDGLENCKVFPGDLVFPHRGAIGRVGIVQNVDFHVGILSTSLMKLRVNENLANPLFVYYYFLSEYGYGELLARASTVGTPGIGQPLSSLRSIPVRLPPLETQRSIFQLLFSLDEKIAANDKALATMDAFIRGLYSHLVSSIDSVVVLGELAREVRDTVEPRLMTSKDRHLGLDLIPRRDIWVRRSESARDVASNKFSFQSGDILFGKLRPYFHKVAAPNFNGVCSTDIVVIRALEDALQEFILSACSSDEIIEFASTLSEGTRMPRIKWKDLAQFQTPWPGEEAAMQFSEEVRHIKALGFSILREREKLSALRDELLPRLMNGTLIVRTAEDLVSDAI